MYETHANLETPPDNTVLWRYIDLKGLIAMLCSRQLHFKRLDQFEDKWEGTWPRHLYTQVSKQFQSQAERDKLLAFLNECRTTHHANCWYAGEHESVAQWKLFAGPDGVAIQTTIGRLKASLDPEVRFFIGSVRYVDLGDYQGAPSNLKRNWSEN